jgi:hypothetical protein
VNGSTILIETWHCDFFKAEARGAVRLWYITPLPCPVLTIAPAFTIHALLEQIQPWRDLPWNGGVVFWSFSSAEGESGPRDVVGVTLLEGWLMRFSEDSIRRRKSRAGGPNTIRFERAVKKPQYSLAFVCSRIAGWL